MKTEMDKRIEEVAKEKIQYNLVNDSIDLSSISDNDFEDCMLQHAYFTQTSILKYISKDYAKSGAKFMMANIGISSLIGALMVKANPTRPIIQSAAGALLTIIPGVIYSVPKFYYASKIGRLAHASQERREVLSRLYVEKDNEPILDLCEKLVNGVNKLENLYVERNLATSDNPEEIEYMASPERQEQLHKQIVNEYLSYLDYCDETYDYFLLNF